MQTIWAKAAQLPGCHCRSCSRSTSAIARQASSMATATTQPRVRFSVVFTAFYSTVMVTAAFIDSGIKNRRRQELVQQIDEAKEKLARLRNQSVGDNPSHAMGFDEMLMQTLDDKPQTKEGLMKSIIRWPSTSLQEVLQQVQRRKAALSSLAPFYRYTKKLWMCREEKRQEREFDLARQESLLELAHIIISEESNIELQTRQPANDLQFSAATHAVDILVARILEAVFIEKERGPLDQGWHLIRLLRCDGYPIYKHANFDPVVAVESRARLNDANRSVFEYWYMNRTIPQVRRQSVYKICYNLLISDYLPGIHAYNLLILAFTQLGEHALADIVAESFLVDSRIQPTLVTAPCLLYHYWAHNNLAGFYNVIRRFWAHDVRGLWIGGRGLCDPSRLPSRRILNWMAGREIGIVGRVLVERAPLTRQVLEAMLRGMLDFHKYRHAAKVFVICLQLRIKINPTLLTCLLMACIDCVDHLAARTLVQGFLDNMDQTAAQVFGERTLPPGWPNALGRLISICEAQVPFASGSSEPRSLFETRVASMRRLRTLIWTRNAQFQLAATRTLSLQVQQIVGDKSPGLLRRLTKVIGVIQMHENGRVEKALERSAYKRLAWLDWLIREVDACKRNVEILTHKVENALAPSVARTLRSTNLFLSGATLEQRLRLHRASLIRGTFSEAVAFCHSISATLDRELKLMLLQALPGPAAETIWFASGDNIDSVGLLSLWKAWRSYLRTLDSSDKDTVADQDSPCPVTKIMRRAYHAPQLPVLF